MLYLGGAGAHHQYDSSDQAVTDEQQFLPRNEESKKRQVADCDLGFVEDAVVADRPKDYRHPLKEAHQRKIAQQQAQQLIKHRVVQQRKPEPVLVPINPQALIGSDKESQLCERIRV